MAVVLSSLYDALRESGASEASAMKAAAEIAANRRARLERDLRVVQWMAAGAVAMTAAVLVKLLV